MTPIRSLARAMLAGIFVVQGAQSVRSPERVAPRAKPLLDRVTPYFEKASPKLPTETEALVRINGAVHVAAGLALMTSLRRPAAAVLAGSLVPTTLAGHAFWKAEDNAEWAAQHVQFLKNLGLMGGLLLAAVDTEGRPTVRKRVVAATAAYGQQLTGTRRAKAAQRAKATRRAKSAQRAKDAQRANAAPRMRRVQRVRGS